MHDLHLAETILKVILENAKKNQLSKVTKVVLQLGSIIEHDSEILPENLIFNLKMLAQETIARDFNIEITKIASDNWVLKVIEGE